MAHLISSMSKKGVFQISEKGREKERSVITLFAKRGKKGASAFSVNGVLKEKKKEGALILSYYLRGGVKGRNHLRRSLRERGGNCQPS